MRRLRGVLITALIWALVWIPIGFALTLLRRSSSFECLYCDPNWLVRFVAGWSVFGAVSGGLFAIVLMIAERRRTLAELSLRRTAVWGAIGALALPTIITILDVVDSPGPYRDWPFMLVTLIAVAGLGASCAAASVALARRAPQ